MYLNLTIKKSTRAKNCISKFQKLHAKETRNKKMYALSHSRNLRMGKNNLRLKKSKSSCL